MPVKLPISTTDMVMHIAHAKLTIIPDFAMSLTVKKPAE